MFGRAAIRLGIGPHSSCMLTYRLFVRLSILSILRSYLSRSVREVAMLKLQIGNGCNQSHVLRVVCVSGSNIPPVQPKGGDLCLFRTTVEDKKGEHFLLLIITIEEFRAKTM